MNKDHDFFNAAVIATMSAGKSTTLNAMLGVPILPAKNEACTATVYKLTDIDEMKGFCARKINNNGTVSEWEKIKLQDNKLIKWNSPDIKLVEIQGDFPNINNHLKKIQFFDTPGPNNSMNSKHADKTNNFLAGYKYDFVIYVMNATQFGINDDKNLLLNLKQELQKTKKEIIFVINKTNELDLETENPVDLLNSARGYLQKIGFNNPLILPLNSLLSLEIRNLMKHYTHNKLDKLSKRKQYGLLSDIQYYLDFRMDYYYFLYLSLFHFATHDNVYETLKELMRDTGKDDYINIRDEKIKIKDIMEVDFLTGIPILEKILDIEVKKYGKKPEITFDSYSNPNLKLIKITHNPYTVKTEIRIEGNLIKNGNLVYLTKNKRLQNWVDKIFEQAIKAARTRDIEFVFKGTEQDCEDFESAFHDFTAKNDDYKNISLKLFPVKSDSDLRIKKFKELYEETKEGAYDEFLSEEMDSKFNKALSPEFEVNVLASMASGKSTFINALIGNDLLPSENMASTETIAKVIDNDNMNNFRARVVDEGGKEITPWHECDNKLLKKWNKDIKNGTIEIEGNIKGVSVRKSTKLVLTDTPGSINSIDEEYFEVINHTINDNQLSMIFYILDATQLQINDDKMFFKMAKKAIEKGGKEAHDRFIFILNKADVFDPGMGEVINEAIKKVKKFIKWNGIKNPTVIPVSSLLSKLIRMKRERQKLKQSDKNNLKMLIELFVEEDEMNLLECSKEFISKRIYNKLNNELQKHKDAKDNEKAAEILSGIPVVEALLDEFTENHAVSAKIKDDINSL